MGASMIQAATKLNGVYITINGFLSQLDATLGGRPRNENHATASRKFVKIEMAFWSFQENIKAKFSRVYRKILLNLHKQSNKRLSRSGLGQVMTFKSESSS